MKNTLINYGKHVDLHNNGKLVYTDVHKVGVSKLAIGSDNLWRFKNCTPIKNIDRKKSYYPHPDALPF